MGLWVIVSWAALLLLALALICFLLYCGYIKYIHMKYDHIPGPPRDSFIFGHMTSILRTIQTNELMHDLFLNWAQTYGPVVRINWLHNVRILITSPNGIKEILMSPKYTKDNGYNRAFSLFGVRLLGNGLVTDQDNDHWRKQRRIMDPAFNISYLVHLMGPFNEKAEELIERLAENADGKCKVKMHNMMSRLTLDVIAKVAFGLELNCLQDKQSPFPTAISFVMKGMAETIFPLAQYIPGKSSFINEVQKSARLLRQKGRECIEKRQKKMNDGEDVPKDILTQILKGAELEESTDPESLLDNFVTFFIAGQETTANQMSFALMELARNPEIMEKVQQEVDEVMGSRRDVAYEDLGKLQYLSKVLKETLRLYPTAPGTSRALTEEIFIEGLKIPPPVTFVLNSYIMGRMEQFYKDPLTFNPDRFSPDAPKHQFIYFPFSLGPRSCIGQVLSQMEAKVVIAKLLQRFDIQLVDGQSFRILDTGTLRPMGGVICYLRYRTKK